MSLNHGRVRFLIGAPRVIRPFPVALNVGATAVFAIIANEGLPAAPVVRLCAAMLCAQAAIGATNDYCDRALDAQTKPFKPIVRGWMAPPGSLNQRPFSSVSG